MKVITFRNRLYAVQSAALQIPLFRHTKENAGAHTDPESETVIPYTDVTTSSFLLMIPWLTITPFKSEPTGLEELFNLIEDKE